MAYRAEWLMGLSVFRAEWLTGLSGCRGASGRGLRGFQNDNTTAAATTLRNE